MGSYSQLRADRRAVGFQLLKIVAMVALIALLLYLGGMVF